MVTTCIVAYCTNRAKKRVEKESAKRSEDITFHSLPNDPQKLSQWVAAISKYRPDYKPGKRHRVCSVHFKPFDFDDDGFRRCLRRNSVPSIFDHIPEHVRNGENPPSKKTMKNKRSPNCQPLLGDHSSIPIANTSSTPLSTPSRRTRKCLTGNQSSVCQSLASASSSVTALSVSSPRTRGRKSLVPRPFPVDRPSLPKATASSTLSAKTKSSLILHPSPVDRLSLPKATASSSLSTSTESPLNPHPIPANHSSLTEAGTLSATLSVTTENSPIHQPLSVDCSALHAVLSSSTLSAPLSPRTKSYLICNSLPVPRVSRHMALSSSADDTTTSGDKHMEILAEKKRLLRRLRTKNKNLQQKVNGHIKAKANLRGIVVELQNSLSVEKKAFELLQSAFCGLSLQLFLHGYTHKDTKKYAMHYKQEIKDFAYTLRHISPLAYNYLKDIFKLPSEDLLRTWKRANISTGQEKEQDEFSENESMLSEEDEETSQLNTREENDFFGTYGSILDITTREDDEQMGDI